MDAPRRDPAALEPAPAWQRSGIRERLASGSLLWLVGAILALLLIGLVLLLARPRTAHLSVPLVADALTTPSVRVPVTVQAPAIALQAEVETPDPDAEAKSTPPAEDRPRGGRWWRSSTLTPAQVVRAQEVFTDEQHRRADTGMAILGVAVKGDGTQLFVSPETPAATRALLPGRWTSAAPPGKSGKLVIGHGVPARRYAARSE